MIRWSYENGDDRKIKNYNAAQHAYMLNAARAQKWPKVKINTSLGLVLVRYIAPWGELY